MKSSGSKEVVKNIMEKQEQGIRLRLILFLLRLTRNTLKKGKNGFKM